MNLPVKETNFAGAMMANPQLRRVISVVTDAFAPFHRDVLNGLQPHFSAAGYGTLAVAGRDVRTDRLLESSAANPTGLRRFGTGFSVCGAVVVSGATPPEMSPEALRSFFDGLTDGPTVSLGITLPGVPSVTIDWEASITELMRHMVEDPRRRRFAFVRGFAGDPHSEQREAGYRAALIGAGLEVDERLIVNGNYSVADALLAVDQLLEGGHRFDAVVASNDDMAVGVIAALNRRGLRVPEDVIVAGFDDSLAAFQSEPPLTTALLDTARLTEETALRLIEAIETDSPLSPDLDVKIDSWLVRRKSTRPAINKRSLNRVNTPLQNAGVLTGRILHRWEPWRAPAGLDIGRLAIAATATMTTGDDSFELVRREFFDLDSAFDDHADGPWLRHAIEELWSVVVELKEGQIGEAGLVAIVEQLSKLEARLRPIEKLTQVERQAQRHLQERLVMGLAACSDRTSLWDTLRTGLGSLGMANAWVVIDDPDQDETAGAASEQMKLLFSLSDVIPPEGEPFARANVLPQRFDALLEQELHVLVPLRAGESDVGYIVIEPSSEHLLELEAIALGIAQVLRNVHQVEDLESQAARLRVANGALDVIARRDSLTGLANRKLLVEHLIEQIAGREPESEFSVLFIDLDGFKIVNDTLGHAAGDQLLRIVADRLTNILGEGDFLARLGGDEFVIVVRDSRDSVDIARSVVGAIAMPFDVLGTEKQISASVGIAACPGDGVTTDDLIKNADTAMYAAKNSGKNRFARFVSPAAAPTKATTTDGAESPLESPPHSDSFGNSAPALSG